MSPLRPAPRALTTRALLSAPVLLLLSLSVASDSLQPRGLQASLSFTLSRGLCKLISIESTRPSNHHPLSAPSPPALVAQMIKNLPAVQETWIRSLGREDPLEEGMAAHSSILGWRIPPTEEPGGLQSLGLQRVGHDLVTKQ